MKRKVYERIKVVELRRKGYSLNEIVKKVNVAKSTVSIWVSTVILSEKAKKKLARKISTAQMASQKTIRAKTSMKEMFALEKAKNVLNNIKVNSNYEKIVCSLIYYCEGNKSVKGGVSFTNSDEYLIKLFLKLFRKSFCLDEKKFSICVYLHSYHNKNKQLKFWSKTTNIPLSQFMKPYFKQSHHVFKKDGYQGCINVRYYNTQVARELNTLAIEYMGLSVNGKPTDSKSVTPRSSRGGPAQYSFIRK